ncbi:hypothetical protein [Persicirhabdus sediminis]|uniref:Uncharacterized protein n=1 Tax=Persicirhabdus sediminis TaxID=454144 RepID=A0A8J7MBS7_9BACT|nr:hypothetical protein [Persicirhabdus sediminis]MBK1790704.1 hypothetical protein [Persicirhabdus sediminis]
MKIPKYWAQGESVGPSPLGDLGEKMRCWGWSDVSVEEATRMGTKRALEVKKRLADHGELDRYDYGVNPLREQCLQDWRELGETKGVIITRNKQGVEVLNTDRVVFVDVDYRQLHIASSLLDTLIGIFARKPQEPARELFERDAIAKLKTVLGNRPSAGVRIYRTAGGLRYLFLNLELDPAGDEVAGLMHHLGADPLYMKLCEKQACYRARLTPKPWRCGVDRLPFNYPTKNDDEQGLRESWIVEYKKTSRAYASCELVDCWGNEQTDDLTERVIDFHDEKSGATSGRPLA